MKIAVNRCYGGFSLSQSAYKFIANRKNLPIYFYWHDYNNHVFRIVDVETPKTIPYFFAVSKDLGVFCKEKDLNKATAYRFESDRSDPDLIAAIETLGKDSYGSCANLTVVEIPDDVRWTIDEYEVHRSW
jgi:hypothetical protein